MIKRILSSFILAVVFAICLSATPTTVKASVSHQVLLTIDLSNPSNAVFTATLGLSSSTDSSTTANDGIDLIGFFNPALITSGGGLSLGGALQPFGSGSVYQQWSADDYFGVPGSPDLNLYATSGAQAFTFNGQAFSGTMTIDLLSQVSALPGLGVTGLIFPGFSGGKGTVLQPIGTWQVVAAIPEPSAFAQAGLGLLGLVGVMVMRRKHR